MGGDVVEVAAVYVAEGTGVRDEGFGGGGEGFAGRDVALEGVFGGVDEVGLRVEGDEMREACDAKLV